MDRGRWRGRGNAARDRGGGRGRGGGDRGGGRGRGGGDGGGRGRGGPSGGGDGGFRGRGGPPGGGDGGFRGRGGPPGGRGGPPPPGLRGQEVRAPPYVPDPRPAPGGAGPTIAPGVTTVGVRRPPGRGTSDTPLTVTTNNFTMTIPEATYHHYDVVIKAEKTMPVKFNMDLIRALQEHIAPGTFTPRVVYDGRKNIFASRELPLSGGKSQTFDVTLEPAREGTRPPKVYKVTLTHVAEINPTLLARYQKGQQSYDNMISTALTATNVVIRMEPIMRYPHNSRSFFTDKEVRPIGGGIELWRGYFQSVRPGLQSMLMNIDISTGTMYSPGPMIPLCHEILRNNSPNALNPGQGLSDRDRLKLQRFWSGVRFITTHKEKTGRVSTKPKVIKKITSMSAAGYKFKGADEKETSVAQYFRSLGTNLQYPNYVCVEVMQIALGILLCR